MLFFLKKANVSYPKRKNIVIIILTSLITILLSLQIEYLCYPILIKLNNIFEPKITTALYVSVIEEGVKSAAIFLLFYKNSKKNFSSVLLIALGIGYAFSLLETLINIIYLYNPSGFAFSTLLWRSTITLLMHISTALAFGVGLALVFINNTKYIKKVQYILGYLLISILIHATYNLLVSYENLKITAIGFIFLTLTALLYKLSHIRKNI